MIHKDYICEVLGRFEGKAIQTGYIPCKGGNYLGVGIWEGREVFGASGVTIGTGVDLGQQTSGGLQKMGVSQTLVEKLTPYLGLKRQAALKKLNEIPLRLTAEEIKELDTAVKTSYINEAARLFGREAFEKSPKQVQAVAVSLHYQFGTLFRAASPALASAWGAMQRGEYSVAAGHLRFLAGWSPDHQQYMVRRRAEAALLEEVV